jgi:hypothetical protein
MRGKWGGPTMTERVARSSADLTECPARHCWVVDSLDGVKRAALLLEWRRRTAVAGDWEGRVVYLAKLRDGEQWTVVEEWVSAACLLPA